MIATKEHFRNLLSIGCVALGGCLVSRLLLPKHGATILYGHRVQDDDEGFLQGLAPQYFEEQMFYLKKHFRFIHLSELVKKIEQAKTVPDNTVVLTFDDGFRDNLLNAAPVLIQHSIPATIFLTTHCISSGQLPWSQQLGHLIQTTRVNSISIPRFELFDLSLETSAQKKFTYQVIKRRLVHLDRVTRDEEISFLSVALKVTLPTDRMLSWQDVQEMGNKGFEFGAHTFSHSLLAEIPFDSAKEEMELSKNDLEHHLGVREPSFCFPGGSLNQQLVDLAISMGFRSVFQPNRRKRVNNSGNSNPFNLNRVGLPNGPSFLLEAELDGPFHFLRNLYRK